MTDSPIELIINSEIKAPIARVFEAWTKPEQLKQWFAPDDEMTVPRSEVDLRVGGEYLIHLHDPKKGEDHIVSGTYEEIVLNEKIVFNWMWKDGVDRTQVTVEFAARGDNETLLTLTHRGFSQTEFRDHHDQGWNACLGQLKKML